MARPLKAVIYQNIGNWSLVLFFGRHFVLGTIMTWDGREPALVKFHQDCGNIKLLLSYFGG